MSDPGRILNWYNRGKTRWKNHRKISEGIQGEVAAKFSTGMPGKPLAGTYIRIYKYLEKKTRGNPSPKFMRVF